MKILFYLEPHPIRDRFDSFGFIGQRVLKMLLDEYVGKRHSTWEPHEMRVLLGRHYGALASSYPALAPAILGITKEENDAIELFKRDWESDPLAIEEWKDLMRGEGSVSEFYGGMLERIYTGVYPFDVVVTWSTNGAVRRFCETHGLHCVALELGCVRDPIYDSAYVDGLGVNGAAISRHFDLSKIEPMDPEVLRLMLPTRGLSGKGLDGVHDVLRSRLAAEIYRAAGNNVLIPLQLRDDSNCLLFSPYDSMLSMLEEVLPQLVGGGRTCFIKPHPAAKDRAINLRDHERCQALVEDFGDKVHWLDDIVPRRDYVALLNKMDFVVTVNSSTGFEAMLYDTPAVILGAAPYRIGERVLTVDAIANDKFDRQWYREYSARVVSAMVGHYLVPQALLFDFQHFCRYLERAMRARELLDSTGGGAMTEYLARESYLDFPRRDSLLAERVLNARYARQLTAMESAGRKAKKAPVAAAPVPETLPAPATCKPERKGRLARKWQKFRRDPGRFLRDSKLTFLRRAGQLLA